MKNIKRRTFFLLLSTFCLMSTTYAQSLIFNNGTKIHLPNYKSKRPNPDGSPDSVCVDVYRPEIIAMICLYNKSSSKIVDEQGFFKYKDLSSEERKFIHPLSDNDYVYAEGSYSAVYATSKKRIGDFIVHETYNVLCKDGYKPAICYASILIPFKNTNSAPAIFISSVLEEMPNGGKVKPVKDKVDEIHKIILSMNIEK